MKYSDWLLLPNNPAWTDCIESELDKPPAEAAPRLRKAAPDAPPGLLAAQLGSLQKARKKLPEHYEARCLLPSLPLEQASSALAGELKQRYEGGLCLDLTLGLGADTVSFARRFRRVVALEADPALAEIARYNFARLGLKNVEIINARAEDFIEAYDGPKPDLIYLDPARRDDRGGRAYALQDCAPNALELLPILRRLAPRVLLKASPMFDVTAGLRDLAGAARAQITSIGGDVRETLFEFRPEAAVREPTLSIRIARGDRVSVFDWSDGAPSELRFATEGQWLLAPDAAFYKAAALQRLLRYYFSSRSSAGLTGPGGWLLAPEAPRGFPGRVLQVLRGMVYKPKELKRYLNTEGVRAAQISAREFPHSANELRARFGLDDGGSDALFFARCRADGELRVWRAREAADATGA